MTINTKLETIMNLTEELRRARDVVTATEAKIMEMAGIATPAELVGGAPARVVVMGDTKAAKAAEGARKAKGGVKSVKTGKVTATAKVRGAATKTQTGGGPKKPGRRPAAEGPSYASRVLDAVNGGPDGKEWTAKSAALATGGSQSAAASVLNRHASAGKIQSPSRGVYMKLAASESREESPALAHVNGAGTRTVELDEQVSA